jgi:hypothetical protein
MMRLVLAPKSMEGIKETTPQIAKLKTGAKIPPKIMKIENITIQDRG